MKIELKDLEVLKKEEEIVFDYGFSETSEIWQKTDLTSSNWDYYLVIDERHDLKTYLCWDKRAKFGKIYCTGKPNEVE